MRYLPLAFLIAACTDPKPIAEDTVARAYCVRASDDVKQLRAELGALPKPDAMTPAIAARLDAIEKRVAAVEQSKGQRVPHLIAVETGVDLGPFAGWDRYYSSDLNEYVALLVGRTYFYALPDCTGQPMVPYVSIEQTALNYAVGLDGVFIRLGHPAAEPMALSSRTKDSAGHGFHCNPITQYGGFRVISDTDIPAAYFNQSDLRIELR